MRIEDIFEEDIQIHISFIFLEEEARVKNKTKSFTLRVKELENILR